MKITREPLGDHVERFEVRIARSDWYGEYEKQLRKARREMSVPGFRRGQAPLGLVAKRMGGEELMFRFVSEAQSRGVGEYVEEQGITVAYPFVPADEEMAMPDLRGEETVTWHYDVVVAPRYELPKSLPWAPVEVESTDAQWEECIKAVVARNMQRVAAEEVCEGAFFDAAVTNAPADETGKERSERDLRLTFSYDDLTDEAKGLFKGRKEDDTVELPVGCNLYAEGASWRQNAFANRVKQLGMEELPLQLKLLELSKMAPAEMSWEFYERYFALQLLSQVEDKAEEEKSDDAAEVGRRFRQRYVAMVEKNVPVSNAAVAFAQALEAWEWSVPEELLKKMLQQEDLGSLPPEYQMERIKEETLSRQLLRLIGEETLQNSEEYKRLGDGMYDMRCFGALQRSGATRMYGILPGVMPIARYFMQSIHPDQLESEEFQRDLRIGFSHAAAGQYLLGQLGLAPRKVGIDKLTISGEVAEEVDQRERASQAKWAQWGEAMKEARDAALRQQETEGEK